jgi:hypothetical protein
MPRERKRQKKYKSKGLKGKKGKRKKGKKEKIAERCAGAKQSSALSAFNTRHKEHLTVAVQCFVHGVLID